MVLSIITVNFGLNTGLHRSLNFYSHYDVEHIAIISGVTETEANLLESKYFTDNRMFLFNLDVGIYNAMNLGLEKAKGDFVFFLNGGDTFANEESLSLILEKLNSRKCHLFRTNQIWKDDVYVRPSLENLNKLLKHPAHQGFVAPLDEKTPRFDESRPIDADMIWMRQCIEIYGADVHEDVVANFYLGGISNYPSLASVKKRYKGQGFARGSFEVIKMLLRIVLGNRIYYRYLAKRAGYDAKTGRY